MAPNGKLAPSSKIFDNTLSAPQASEADEPLSLRTAHEVRLACRTGGFCAPTAGLCPGYVQANIIILPAQFASEFKNFCARNPVSCPLIGETEPGNPVLPRALAVDADVRTDAPSYNIYEDGKLVKVAKDITNEWQAKSVAFFIGCSFSFEAALCAKDLTPRHISSGTNVPMYKTTIPLFPSGVFHGHMILSMRPYKPTELDQVRNITRPFRFAHGEPVDWGFDACSRLGIQDINKPDFGDRVDIHEGEIPVFWGCGVTPQEAVMESKIPGIVMGHTPGMMMCLDMVDKDVCEF